MMLRHRAGLYCATSATQHATMALTSSAPYMPSAYGQVASLDMYAAHTRPDCPFSLYYLLVSPIILFFLCRAQCAVVDQCTLRSPTVFVHPTPVSAPSPHRTRMRVPRPPSDVVSSQPGAVLGRTLWLD